MSEPSHQSVSKTVFVIGAGASEEAGLPVGSKLKVSIANALNIQAVSPGRLNSGDAHIFEALHRYASQAQHPNVLNNLLGACQRIYNAMPQAISIDNYLDVQSHDKDIELCGKLAIVREILKAEAKSSLFVDSSQGKQQLPFANIECTWYDRFFKRLTENCKPSNLEERLHSVVLIIFNYDRCIEQYLYYAIQNFYPSLGSSQAAELIRKIEIYHPYGTVGALPWQGQDEDMEYGAIPSSEKLLQLASQIKTFTEGTDESSSHVKAIRSHMITAHRLVFLGFAFHPLNLDLLLPKTAVRTSQRTEGYVFATAFGISDSDISAICDDLASRRVSSARDITIHKNMKCWELFQEHTRGLSFI